jgi:hypothetical protein
VQVPEPGARDLRVKLWAGAEAEALGRGGLASSTVTLGRNEVRGGGVDEPQPSGGEEDGGVLEICKSRSVGSRGSNPGADPIDCAWPPIDRARPVQWWPSSCLRKNAI